MKKGILLFTILCSTFTFGQSNFKEVISETVSKHSTTKSDSIIKSLNYKGGDKVKVFAMFSINKNGEVINITARGPHKIFEDEAIRLIESLPKLDPPKNMNGQEAIRFTLPITIIIESDAEKKKRIKKEQRKKKKLKNKERV